MSSALDRVTAVFVTYNSEDLVDRALDALPPGLRIILVDNASGDQTAHKARQHPRQPKVIQNAQNHGFGSAANLGLAEVETDYGLLLNVDLLITGAAVEGLVEAADRYPDAAILSPEIREPDGTLQFGRHPHLSPLFPAHGWSPIEPVGDCCAAYAGGASMLLRMDIFRRLGGFDESLFLFGDDDDLCLRVTKAGYSLIHVAGLHADHGAGKSSQGVPRLTYWKQWHMAWSRAYLEAKHNSPSAADRLAQKEVSRQAWKAIAYGVLGMGKAERYRGRRDGFRAFLKGVKAQDVRLGPDS